MRTKRNLLLFAMLTIAAASGFAQDGEIIYNGNIVPSEMHTESPWPQNLRIFDFDSDSTNDFFIAWTQYREWHVVAYTYNDWWFTQQTLQLGDTIPSVDAVWYPEPEDTDLGPMIAFFPGYSHDSIIVALKKQVAEDVSYYGWIRFSIDAGPMRSDKAAADNRVPWPHGVLTFIDYAYCTRPNYPLRAGQTSFEWSAEEYTTAFATIHPNPTNGLVAIAGENLKAAEAFNALGQRVASATGKGEQLQIDLSGLPAGVYFVNITDSEGRKCVRKVVKE